MPQNSNSPDFYERLGVASSASEAEIKKAFRELARKLHPDQGGNATEFALVSEAADVLQDPTARAAYDFDRKATKASSSGASKKQPHSTQKPPPQRAQQSPSSTQASSPGPSKPSGKATIALCPHCGSMNRVKGDPGVVPANCGRCGRDLNPASAKMGSSDWGLPSQDPSPVDAKAADSWASIARDAARATADKIKQAEEALRKKREGMNGDS